MVVVVVVVVVVVRSSTTIAQYVCDTKSGSTCLELFADASQTAQMAQIIFMDARYSTQMAQLIFSKRIARGTNGNDHLCVFKLYSADYLISYIQIAQSTL